MSDAMTNPSFVFIVSIAILAVVSTVGYYWHAARRDELAAAVKRDEIALKLEMVKAGMSADDIARVTAAASGRTADVLEAVAD